MASPTFTPTDSGSPSSCETGPNARTPPGRDSDFLLTPPVSNERPSTFDSDVDAAIEVFQTCRDRPDASTLAAPIQLQQRQFRQLMEELERDPPLSGYVKDKVAFDYDPESGVLNIRMPTPVHDFFSTSLADEIGKQLRDIAGRGGPAGEFAAQIANGGSSRILLADDVEAITLLQRQPDAQFQHAKAAYPGVVLEISYSQDGKDLDKLAWQYIQKSNGNIIAVIGVDINYRGKASAVSLWQAHYYRENGDEVDTLDVNRKIKCELFRSSDGSHANQAQNLQLTLSDFATDELYKVPESVMLSVAYGRLAELLDRAEQLQKVREQPTGVGVKSEKVFKKRKRSSSPPDCILPDDEARFRSDEETAMKKAADKDGIFRPRKRP